MLKETFTTMRVVDTAKTSAASPAVATLICVYRGDTAQAFAAALDSVLGQAGIGPGKNRIYLHVDGPVDEAIEQVAQTRPLHVVVRSPQSIGLAAGLNRLIDRLSDETYVFRMDSDDVSLAGRYARQIAFLDAHPDIDIVGGAITELSEDGRSRTVPYPQSSADCRSVLPYRNPLAHPTVCFRRSVFETGVRYPESAAYEDLALWFVCAARGMKFANLPDVLLTFSAGASFHRRRGALSRSLGELGDYFTGLRQLRAPAYFYALPVLRLLMRLAPVQLSKAAYAVRGRWWGR